MAKTFAALIVSLCIAFSAAAASSNPETAKKAEATKKAAAKLLIERMR